jgi:ABC-type oligopeptide transport system substrate-binding subunit
LPVVLAFEKGDFDYATVRGIASTHLLAKGMLRPDYAARGMRHIRYPVPALMYTCFNLDDAVVGGNAPDRVALRRAIGLGFNVQEYLRVVQGGDGMPATQLLPPGVDGQTPAPVSAPCTTRSRRVRCSIASATSIATATAIASVRTERLWCSRRA